MSGGGVMQSLRIWGGTPLTGSIRISGAKNAALPILFATLATEGTSRIRNLPDITDVNVALSILSDMGAEIKREGSTLTNRDFSSKY